MIWLSVAVGVVGTLGRIASAALLEHAPLVLVALSPFPSHMLLVVPLTPMAPFVVVGTLRRGVACVLAYLLGEEYGEQGIVWAKRRYPRAASWIALLERLFARARVPVLFVSPTLGVCALAGATRMPLWLFLPVALGGQALWIALTYLAGDALRDFTTPLLAFISQHWVAITALLLVVVGGFQLVRLRARRRAALAELVPRLRSNDP